MTEQPTKDDRTPCYIEKSPARILTEAFVNSVSTVYSRYDYEKFCELLDLKPDKYGAEKWRLFNALAECLNNFDLLTLTKIVETGSPKLEAAVRSEPQALVEPPPLVEPPSPESSNVISP
jgi:hypothetical protein